MTRGNSIKRTNYKRNFLKNVILRLDFESVQLDFLTKFTSDIKAEFPISEQKEIPLPFFVKSGTGSIEQVTQQKVFVWIYQNLNKTKNIQIGSDHLVLQYLKYKNSEELLGDVDSILAKFLTMAKVETLNRIGLRYKNELDFSSMKEGFVWSDYLSKNLIGNLDFSKKNKVKVARAVSKLVVKEEDADITFNYGIWNNDFPNEGLRKEFLLDLDCYSRLPVSIAEVSVKDIVKKFNLYIEKLFESSITDNFRKYLNKK